MGHKTGSAHPTDCGEGGAQGMRQQTSLWTAIYHPEIPRGLSCSQGVSGCIPRPNSSDLWLCFTWSSFFYHVSICIHKEQWGLLGKKYSYKREVTPYSLCAISLVKIDITMSFLMQSPLVSLPSRRKPLNQKHLSTVIKLSPLRPHSLPLFWPLPGRNYLTF